MDTLAEDCLVLVGQYTSLRTFYRLLEILKKTEILSEDYRQIAPLLRTDLLPFRPVSIQDAFATIRGKDRVRFMMEVEMDMIRFLCGMEELDLHFLLDREEYEDVRVWRFMDGLRLIHHPRIYAKVFTLRHYSLEDVLSMLTPEEMDELLGSMIPSMIYDQLFSYQWTHRI